MAKRILIADDHESVLRRVRGVIESQPDWQVCGEAVNGRDAITKAHELNPDLVILDFAMPNLDGLKTSLEIKKLLPEVPIVMFTMYGSQLADEVKKYGITRMVDKAQSEALVAAVGELLETQKQHPVEKSPQMPMPVSPRVLGETPKTEISPLTIRKAG